MIKDQTGTRSAENLYDKYSKMLYGIALEVSPFVIDAEIILIKTFKKAHQQNIVHRKSSEICVLMIKLVIQCAHEVLLPDAVKHNFKLKQFENSPYLHHLLCEQSSIHDICLKYTLTPIEVSKNIREELNLLRLL